MRTALAPLLLSVALAACASAGDTGAPDVDAGGLDDASFDAQVIDANNATSSPSDAASPDAPDVAPDTSPDGSDVSSPDASPEDTGSDGGPPADASPPDAAPEDAGSDGALADVDAGSSDAGSSDAGSSDAADVAPPQLESVLAQLRASTGATMAGIANGAGWPLETSAGWLIVDVDTGLPSVAGDFDGWAGTALTADEGFSYAVVSASPGDGYKFTDGASDYRADPWSRAYGYDENGEISYLRPSVAHLERFFAIGDGAIAPRRLRVWVPAEPVTHTLYAHDGQNLFEDSQASFGVSWELDESAPAGMMIVGIDNTAARLDEYGHVVDRAGTGTAGGLADDYADYVRDTVRPLIREAYGEGARVGVMGSSMGGLVSLYIAHVQPGEWDMAISLSGALSWGSRGVNDVTIHALYAVEGMRDTAIYVDSGGGVEGVCVDSDGDGLNDDATDSDGYCVNRQFADQLAGQGYTWESDLWHWHEPGALHNEAAWAARVFRPLEHFAAR